MFLPILFKSGNVKLNDRAGSAIRRFNGFVSARADVAVNTRFTFAKDTAGRVAGGGLAGVIQPGSIAGRNQDFRINAAKALCIGVFNDGLMRGSQLGAQPGLKDQVLLSTKTVVTRFFGDDFIHEDVVLLHGDLIEHLALERQRHERGVEPGMFQQFIVIPFSVSRPSPSSIEGHTGDNDQVNLFHIHLFRGNIP